MSLTIVGTVRRTNDIVYGSSALVSGLDVGETLTRDYDIWDTYTSLTWSGDSTTFKNFHTPTSAESGVLYYLLFDGTYYCYGEHTYYWDGVAGGWSFAGIQNRCRDNASARSLMIQEVGGIFKTRVSGALLTPDATAKFRFAMVKP